MSTFKTKTYNKRNFRKEADDLFEMMYSLYAAFCEVEYYCSRHLDEDLSKMETLEVQLQKSYDDLLDDVCSQDYQLATINNIWFDRASYMRDIVNKVCH